MIEEKILAGLIYNEEFARKTRPYLQEDYFADESQRILFKLIGRFWDKYNKPPTIDVLAIELQSMTGMTQAGFEGAKGILQNANKPEEELEWLIDSSETFCKDRALYNALMESISIVDGKQNKDNLSLGSIPKLLQDALAVNFDTKIGHDWSEDAFSRYEFYHLEEDRIPFDIDSLNKITKGGVPKKTLNVILAGVNVGKTLVMCSLASSNMMRGLNVLYITMEMSQERIAERIDANLLDIQLNDLEGLSKHEFMTKVERVKTKTVGRLVVKEFPTGGAGSNHFRHLLQELKIKKNFVPDVIYVDYLNICTTSKVKLGGSVNTYTFVKSIAEELRGLAVEYDVPIWTATQVNRTGFKDSDFDMDNTSESWGIPETADFMIALIETPELAELSQLMIKQLKNRYQDKSIMRKFVVGVDKPKMRMYDLDAGQMQQNPFNTTKTTVGPTVPTSNLQQKFGNFNMGD